MLAQTIDIVKDAYREGRAVGAFNTYNLELTHAIVAAAEQMRQPIILQLGVQSLKIYGKPLVAGTLAAAETVQVPVAVHLDHCSDLALIEQILTWGVSSVLADGSRLSFAENIAFTRQAVLLASRHNAIVEAELGYLAGTEDGITIEAIQSSLTDPMQASEFLEKTGAALLAVSIGNVHGYTPNPPALDFVRLKQIATQVREPLVLHGASGLQKVEIQRAIQLGVAKINVNTEVRTAFVKAIAGWGVRIGPVPDLRKKGQDLLDVMQEAMSATEYIVKRSLQISSFQETADQE